MIYAVDFDGTLCAQAWPEIGQENIVLINYLKRKREKGDQVVLWTMREGELLENALNWCEKYGLNFDAVNDNTKEQKEMYGNNPRKVYADVYIDDHNWRWHPWEYACLD